MNKVLTSLFLASLLNAQETIAIAGVPAPSPSLDNPTVAAGGHAKIIDVRAYLAPCAGGADMNACVTNAANQARAAGVALHLPAGTYRLSGWTPVCPLVIVGDGIGKTILQRPANSAGSVISSTSCGGLQIKNLTIDGNKANNSAIGYSVLIHRSWNFRFDDVEIKNSKGLGSALTVQNAADDDHQTHSVLSKLSVHDNDGNGVYFQKRAWNWSLENSDISNNGRDGVTVIDFVFPPERAQFSDCAIVQNNISNNGGNGVSLVSGISGGTPSLVSNGPFNTVENCRIIKNQVNHNAAYGIIMSGGKHIEISSNTTTYNGGGAGIVFAGINSALCTECDVHDNTSTNNAFYGIDTGGAVDTRVHHNVITNNGNEHANNGNGVNCGACQGVEIADNSIANNGSAGGGAQIHVTTYDGGSSGFSISARDVSIRRNRIICGNANAVGVQVLADPSHTTVEDNVAEGCSAYKGYVLNVTDAQVRGNRQNNWSGGLAASQVNTSGAVVYPDAEDDIDLQSVTVSKISAIWPHFYSTNHQTVYAVVVTGGGSGYSTAPKVSFSGGDCATEPTGFVFQDNVGHVVGVNLTSFGSGCREAPKVLFSDRSGSGASATAFVLMGNPVNGRTLTVAWPSGAAVTHDPKLIELQGGTTLTIPRGASYRSTLEGKGDHWIETARSAPTR